jgi:hypothetical protein
MKMEGKTMYFKETEAYGGSGGIAPLILNTG